MTQWVNPDAVKAARQADLYDFLLCRRHNDVKKEGNNLRLRGNNSVSVGAGPSSVFTSVSAEALNRTGLNSYGIRNRDVGGR